MESTEGPEEPLASGTILTDGPSGPTQQDFQPPRWAEWAEWVEWADSTGFSATPGKGWGYDTAEVDAFRQEIRDTFLGVLQPPLTLDEARDKRFRMAWRGYKVGRLTPSLMKPNRGWRRCGRPTGDPTDGGPSGSAGAFIQSGREFMLMQ